MLRQQLMRLADSLCGKVTGAVAVRVGTHPRVGGSETGFDGVYYVDNYDQVFVLVRPVKDNP